MLSHQALSDDLRLADCITANIEAQIVHVVVNRSDFPLIGALRVFITGALV
jgi:hypothetical protein